LSLVEPRAKHAGSPADIAKGRQQVTAYEFFKDFAGPIATVTAAGVAVFVTLKLGRRQAAAAERQSEIARNKLMADIFDRRFSAYEAAMKTSEVALFEDSDQRLSNPDFHKSAYAALQAEFLFPPEIFPYVKSIVDQ